MISSRLADVHARCCEWVRVPAPRATDDKAAALELLEQAALQDTHLATFAADAMIGELAPSPALERLHTAAESVDDDELRLAMYRSGLKAIQKNPDLPAAELAQTLLSLPQCENAPWDAARSGALLLRQVETPAARLALAASSSRLERDSTRLEIFRLALAHGESGGREDLGRLGQQMINTAHPNRLHAIWVAAALARALPDGEGIRDARELIDKAVGGDEHLASLAAYQALFSELAEPDGPQLARLASGVVSSLPADCELSDAVSTCTRLVAALDVPTDFTAATSLEQLRGLALGALDSSRARAEQEVWRLATGPTGPAVKTVGKRVWVGGVGLPVNWKR